MLNGHASGQLYIHEILEIILIEMCMNITHSKATSSRKPLSQLQVYLWHTNAPTILNIIGLDYGLSPGGRLNKKDGLTKYGDSHVKDKTS